MLLYRVKPFRTARNFIFCHCSLSFEVQHDMCDNRQQACPFPAGVVSLVFGEVKHVVHLIRWNLKAVYAIGARLDHGPGAGNNRTTFRKLGTESCFNFLWFHQLIPIGPLSHAFFPPQVGWLRRVLRCL